MSAEKRIELCVLEAALAFGKACLDSDAPAMQELDALKLAARDLAEQRNSVVTAGIVDKLDVGAAGPFPTPKTLIIEAIAPGGDKQRLVIDQRNNITAERLTASPVVGWERLPWLVDASNLIGYALRRAICRGIDEAEIVETTDVVIIELGEIK